MRTNATLINMGCDMGNSHTAATAFQILHRAIGRGTNSLFTMERRPTQSDTHTATNAHTHTHTAKIAECERLKHLGI